MCTLVPVGVGLSRTSRGLFADLVLRAGSEAHAQYELLPGRDTSTVEPEQRAGSYCRAVPTPPGQPVLQLRVTLQHVLPPISRRLLVPGSVRLDKLHSMFQAAMGWEDYHLHSFRIGNSRYGMPFDDYPDDELDETAVTAAAAVAETPRFIYEYDFGDRWDHEVVVESNCRLPVGLKFAVCVDGQNACPPEDVGGPPGYASFLEALNDPNDEEHEHMRQWVGRPFDPNDFDLALTNARLQRVR